MADFLLQSPGPADFPTCLPGIIHMENVNLNSDWTSTKAKTFWSEIASCEHVLHIYENEANFLDMLAGFAGEGINAGESIIVIATESHLNNLYQKLTAHGIHVPSLVAANRYFPLNASDTLDKILLNGWPDESAFKETVGEIVRKAKEMNNRVRVFGEMVSLLWNNGKKEATLEVESLWNKFCQVEKLQLFCAYPRAVFNKEDGDSIAHICQAHSKIIRETDHPISELLYQTIPEQTA